VLDVRDGLDLVGRGSELRWTDPPGSPRAAARAEGVQLWLTGQDRPLDVGSYLRLPIRGPGGETVAVVLAVDTEPAGRDLRDELATAEAAAGLLGTIVSLACTLFVEQRRATLAEAESLFDPLTGVGNRRHWSRLLEAEDSRCRRHGLPAAVIVADLDALKEVNDRYGHAAGDDVLRRAGAILKDVSRGHDAVARLGGDEFAVLAVGCGHADAEALAHRLRAALDEAGIPASVGFAGRHPAGGLPHAWRRADAAMYDDKRRRAGLVHPRIDLTTAAARDQRTG
jgi:diguanylate cyclase (GGDEF)-like protein